MTDKGDGENNKRKRQVGWEDNRRMADKTRRMTGQDEGNDRAG